jgi:hypothetical protein
VSRLESSPVRGKTGPGPPGRDSAAAADWTEVTRRNPCPVCEGTTWCSVADDGTAVCCRRQPNGATLTKNDKNGALCYIHVLAPAGTDPEPAAKRPEPKAKGPPVPAADVATRHAVYSAVLDALALSPYHRETLRQRGLTDETITANGYRSVPEKGPSIIKRRFPRPGK